MTIKKRLFISNILMLVVPVVAAFLVGLLCIGFIWLFLINGAGLGIHDQEDFERACLAITEVMEARLDRNAELSSLNTLLESNGLTARIMTDDAVLYKYGVSDENDEVLLSASKALTDEGTVSQNGRCLYMKYEHIGETDYTIYLFGGSNTQQNYSDLKVALVCSALLIAFVVFLSIFATNRFLTKFVFRRISEPLDILSAGVNELRDGNLDYRISYDRFDEFMPVCEDFNEMALRLKQSVTMLHQQERSRKELIAGISHDIRSPLTSIKAYVEGLLDGIAQTPDAQMHYLKTIQTKAADLEHMVSQLFLFSKMDLGEYPDNPSILRLDETIRETIYAVQEEYRKKGLLVELQMKPAAIYADPVQVQRIISNLLENSAKYKKKDFGMVLIFLEETEKEYRLCFADDGPGVPEQALPHLFEVFYRSDPARQNPEKGSGLGLAIVARAVQRMGGTIAAGNGQNGGLEIVILLPKSSEVIQDAESIDYRR